MRDARARTGPPRTPSDGADHADEGNRSAQREGRQASGYAGLTAWVTRYFAEESPGTDVFSL